IAGDRQRGRPGTEQCDALAVLLLGDLGHEAVDVALVVGRDTFQPADRDWLLLDPAPAAGRLTGPITDPAEDAGEDVRLPIQHIGRCIAALCDEPDVLWNGCMARARPLTVYDLVEVLGIGNVRRSHPPAPGAHSGVALRHLKSILRSFGPEPRP